MSGMLKPEARVVRHIPQTIADIDNGPGNLVFGYRMFCFFGQSSILES